MPYKCGLHKCDLCLAEKVAIAKFVEVGLLNKGAEWLSKCRHRNKFVILNIALNFCCEWSNNSFVVQISVECYTLIKIRLINIKVIYKTKYKTKN